jgi:hypothetical protein
MLKRMLQALSPSARIGFPELPPLRPPPKPLPEAAVRHRYEPTTPLRGSTIGPMWIEAGAARSDFLRTMSPGAR